jgi:hypothetical protein
MFPPPQDDEMMMEEGFSDGTELPPLPVGRMANMRFNLEQKMADYGNPVLDAPDFDPSVFEEAGPSMGGDMGMGGGFPGGDSMGGPPPDINSIDPTNDISKFQPDMMALLQRKAMARKMASDKFQADINKGGGSDGGY